jgi:hypothetical protein
MSERGNKLFYMWKPLNGKWGHYIEQVQSSPTNRSLLSLRDCALVVPVFRFLLSMEGRRTRALPLCEAMRSVQSPVV